ncbi:hypothetical protein K0M31_006923 [Melipona bicolor]|uniref:Uncharacterized protein n=1 Tax=Melipona bicolor TaxID=60889 RepID=A0AA40FRA9_9HYME|nr:hypothetical protein K0M31_006923 [Melipona bicolor]
MQAMGSESVPWKLWRRGKPKERKKRGNGKTRERIPVQGRGSTFDRCTQIEMCGAEGKTEWMKAASQWGVSDKDRGIVCDRVISELRRLRGVFREDYRRS